MLAQIKPAIYENLQDLYNGTFNYEHETDLMKNPLDSHNSLEILRDYIVSALGFLMTDEDEFINVMSYMQAYVAREGRQYGHIFYFFDDSYKYSGTGSWSVRLGTINRIIAMIEFQPYNGLPKYPNPSFSFLHPWDSNERGKDFMIVDVYAVDFHRYHCVYRLCPRYETINGNHCTHVKWEVCQDYTDKSPCYLAEFKEYTK